MLYLPKSIDHQGTWKVDVLRVRQGQILSLKSHVITVPCAGMESMVCRSSLCNLRFQELEEKVCRDGSLIDVKKNGIFLHPVLYNNTFYTHIKNVRGEKNCVKETDNKKARSNDNDDEVLVETPIDFFFIFIFPQMHDINCWIQMETSSEQKSSFLHKIQKLNEIKKRVKF